MSGKKLETGIVVVIAIGLLVWPLFAPAGRALLRRAGPAIYALIGLSLVVLVGWTGQVSLGHAAFVGFGCYFGAKMLVNGIPFDCGRSL